MSLPPSCRQAVDLLWEYVREGLDERDTTLVERHLQHCLRCCGEVAFVRELQRRLAGPPTPLPVDVEGRLETFLANIEPAPGDSA